MKDAGILINACFYQVHLT